MEKYMESFMKEISAKSEKVVKDLYIALRK